MSSRGVNFGGCNHDTIRTGKDIACSGVPFNWNGSLIGADPSGYLAGLRVGYIKESFDLDDELAKANAAATLDVLKQAGVYELCTATSV